MTKSKNKTKQPKPKGQQLQKAAGKKPRRKQLQRQRGSNQQGSLTASSMATMFAPVSEGTIMKSLKPQFFRSDHRSQRIVHREKIGKYLTPGDGSFKQLASLPINPGVPTSFPWLSNEAAGWERYRFNALRYIWVPAIGTAVAGNIIMGPDYDASDAAPYGETALSSYENTEEGNVWCRFAAELDPTIMHGDMKEKYLRFGPAGAGQDVKTLDSGNFFLYSSDDAAVQAGKLWVEYDVTLFNPQVPPGGFQGSGTIASGGGGSTNVLPFGNTPVVAGPVGISMAANIMTLTGVQPGQRVAVAINIQGTVLAALSLDTYVGIATSTTIANVINAGGTAAVTYYTLNVTAPNPSFKLDFTATTITAVYGVVTILAPQPGF